VPAPDVSRAGHRVLVCQGSVCQAGGALEARLEWIRRLGRPEPGGPLVVPTACLRLCVAAPVAVVYPEGAWFGRVRARRVRQVWEAVSAGRPEQARGFLYRLEVPDHGG
jgi:(2Fe-2S) ferredoxin